MRLHRAFGHPRDPDTIYLATSLGVLHSEDAGVHWQPLQDGLPAVTDVIDVALADLPDQGAIRLWAATYGHGVWHRLLPDDALMSDGFEP
jgi:hypothetical protein